MYDDEIRKDIISELENKVNNIVETSMSLASQGYLVNKDKYARLYWSSILIHAFENINILRDEQKHNVELLYSKLSTI